MPVKQAQMHSFVVALRRRYWCSTTQIYAVEMQFYGDSQAVKSGAVLASILPTLAGAQYVFLVYAVRGA